MSRQRGALRLEGRTWRLIVRRAAAPGEKRTQRSLTIGTTKDLPTRAAARRAADRLLERTDPREMHAGTVLPWSAWCDRFLDLHVPLHASKTQRTQASIIRCHLRDAFAGPVHEIDVAAVQDFIHAQRKAGTAPATVRARFNLLRRMLRQAKAEGLAANPPQSSEVRFPKDEQVHAEIRRKAYTAREVELLLANASPADAAAFALMRYLGLRPSEALGLQWSLIDLEAGTVTIRQQAIDGQVRPLKTRHSHAVLKAPSVLIAHLRTIAPTAGADFLFHDADGRPERYEVLLDRLHVLQENLGIPRRGLHAFRHACALAMADAGCSPEVMRRAMRHSALAVTSIYLSAAPEDIAAGLERASVPASKEAADAANL